MFGMSLVSLPCEVIYIDMDIPRNLLFLSKASAQTRSLGEGQPT